MLSDDELTSRIEAEVMVKAKDWKADILILDDPPGAWVSPQALMGIRLTGGPSPFFIDRRDGRCHSLGLVGGPQRIREWLRDGPPGAKAFLDGTASDPAVVGSCVKFVLLNSK